MGKQFTTINKKVTRNNPLPKESTKLLGKTLVCPLCHDPMGWKHFLSAHISDQHGHGSDCGLCGRYVGGKRQRTRHTKQFHASVKSNYIRQNAFEEIYRSDIPGKTWFRMMQESDHYGDLVETDRHGKCIPGGTIYRFPYDGPAEINSPPTASYLSPPPDIQCGAPPLSSSNTSSSPFPSSSDDSEESHQSSQDWMTPGAAPSLNAFTMAYDEDTTSGPLTLSYEDTHNSSPSSPFFGATPMTSDSSGFPTFTPPSLAELYEPYYPYAQRASFVGFEEGPTLRPCTPPPEPSLLEQIYGDEDIPFGYPTAFENSFVDY